MKLISLVLPSPDPDRLAAFYLRTLDLPTSQVDDATWEVVAGYSRLRIVAGEHGSGAHHLAFAVPMAKFATAKAWLGAKTDLIVRDGQDEFEFEPPFGPARSFYFADTDGSVLEFIARPGSTSENALFDPAGDLIGLAEIAVPVTSVMTAVDQLARAWTLRPVLNGERFAAVGDAEGMFILVAADRVWFPTKNRRPNPAPLTVDIATGASGAAPSVRFSNNTVARSKWM